MSPEEAKALVAGGYAEEAFALAADKQAERATSPAAGGAETAAGAPKPPKKPGRFAKFTGGGA